MKSPAWDETILLGHRAYIEAPEVQRAFDELLARVIALKDYEGEQGRRGKLRDFRILDPISGERPFSFATYRSYLVFYVRKSGKRRVPGGLAGLKNHFANVSENPDGEWKVRIEKAADARKLSEFLFGRGREPRSGTAEAQSTSRVSSDSGVNPGADWTEAEIRLLVADYFDMLRMEREGLPYSKAEHNAALQAQLPGRSRGSIEYKHQNVSGVLCDENFPFLDGYKPARNYQRRLLPPIVLELLESGNAAVKAIEQAAEAVIKPVEEDLDFSLCEVPAPALSIPPTRSGPSRLRRARKYDYAARDGDNRKLGRAGEEFILRREHWYLQSIGRDDLSRRLEWVSDTRGDGLGYDLVSYSPETEKEIYIEVKTTNCGERFPFYVTHSEVEVAEELASQYRLARVFNFSTRPQFYSVVGNLREAFLLSPKLFEARR